MAVNEVIVSSFYRRLIDKSAKLWQRISYWTKSSDVEFNDGRTAEEKLGDINGITSDFSTDNENISASSCLTHAAYDRFQEFTDNGRIVSIKIGEDGKPYIEYKDGADTVLKKLGDVDITNDNIDVILKKSGWSDKEKVGQQVTYNVTIQQKHIDNDYKFYIFMVATSGAINTSVASININQSNFGENAVLLGNLSAGGSRPDWVDATGGNIMVRIYALPPQKIDTKLRVCVGGLHCVCIYGVK